MTFKHPMLMRMIHQALVGNRELKIPAQKGKDGTDERRGEILEC